LGVLYAATTVFGISSIAVALAMIRARTVLDVWWEMAGVLSGGMLGLFLLGMLVRRAGRAAAASGVVAGLVVIGWMSLSPRWPAAAGQFAYRGHSFLIIVAGTITILLVGPVVSRIFPSRYDDAPPVESPLERPL
jgi:SSS family solute:Na+ symporter